MTFLSAFFDKGPSRGLCISPTSLQSGTLKDGETSKALTFVQFTKGFRAFDSSHNQEEGQVSLAGIRHATDLRAQLSNLRLELVSGSRLSRCKMSGALFSTCSTASIALCLWRDFSII